MEGMENPVKVFIETQEKADSPIQTPQTSPTVSSSESGSEDSSLTDSQSSQKDSDDGGLSQEASPPHGGSEVALTKTAQGDHSPPSEQEVAEDSKKVVRGQEEPELAGQTLGGIERPNLGTNGRDQIDTSIEAAVEETTDNCFETEAIEVARNQSASPPEYCWNVPKEEFSKDSKWKKTKKYTKGKLNLETKVSIEGEVTPRDSQVRNTSVIIQLTVPPENYDESCEYNAKAKVILYDEKAGRIIKKSKEKRRFEKEYVKFIVGIGVHQEIEESRSKELQLQIKVQVDEHKTYRTYWDKLIVSNSLSKPAH